MKMAFRLAVFVVFINWSAVAFATAFVAYVDDNQQIVVSPTNGPAETVGFDFQSTGGYLIPPDGIPAFDELAPEDLPNNFFTLGRPNENQVSIGRLGTSILISDDFFTGIGYSGDPASGDLFALYGSDARAVVMPVRVGDELIVGSPNTGPISNGGNVGNGNSTDGDSPGGSGSDGGFAGGGMDPVTPPNGGSNSVPEPTAIAIWCLLGAIVSVKRIAQRKRT